MKRDFNNFCLLLLRLSWGMGLSRSCLSFVLVFVIFGWLKDIHTALLYYFILIVLLLNAVQVIAAVLYIRFVLQSILCRMCVFMYVVMVCVCVCVCLGVSSSRGELIFWVFYKINRICLFCVLNSFSYYSCCCLLVLERIVYIVLYTLRS